MKNACLMGNSPLTNCIRVCLSPEAGYLKNTITQIGTFLAILIERNIPIVTGEL